VGITCCDDICLFYPFCSDFFPSYFVHSWYLNLVTGIRKNNFNSRGAMPGKSWKAYRRLNLSSLFSCLLSLFSSRLLVKWKLSDSHPPAFLFCHFSLSSFLNSSTHIHTFYKSRNPIRCDVNDVIGSTYALSLSMTLLTSNDLYFMILWQAVSLSKCERILILMYDVVREEWSFVLFKAAFL